MDTQLERLETERAALAQRLLASLDMDTDLEEAWGAEVERRIADVESGAAQVIPMDEALAQVRSSLK
ncbi:MAG: addiction module protein [Thermoanaerobaculia bacterium]